MKKISLVELDLRYAGKALEGVSEAASGCGNQEAGSLGS